MSKELTLGIWERLELLKCIPRDAVMTEVSQLLRLVDVLQLTEAERETCNWQNFTVQGPQGPEKRAAFNEFETELEVDTADYEKLIQLARGRQKWPVDSQTIVLRKKLGME